MAIPVNQIASGAIDHRASRTGLRAVATFEAFKGALVLLLLIALVLVHNRIEDYVEDLLYHLHIDFDNRFAQSILKAASRVNDSKIWFVSVAAIMYALVRFIEAWGLWNQRVWAEWFAMLSGALYLPWEMLEVARRATWEHVTILLANIVIVVYMLFIRIRESRSKKVITEIV